MYYVGTSCFHDGHLCQAAPDMLLMNTQPYKQHKQLTVVKQNKTGCHQSKEVFNLHFLVCKICQCAGSTCVLCGEGGLLVSKDRQTLNNGLCRLHHLQNTCLLLATR